MDELTTADVQAALDATGLTIEIIALDESGATAAEAAAALGTELGSIAKSIVFMVDGNPVVVITAGDQKVDDKKLSLHFGVGRKKIKAAKADECIQHIGYAPGGVPPVGHRTAVTLLIDETLSRFETVYGAAGHTHRIFPIRYEDLVATTQGTVMDVIKEPS